MGTTITVTETITYTVAMADDIQLAEYLPVPESHRIARYVAARIRRNTAPLAVSIGEDLSRTVVAIESVSSQFSSVATVTGADGKTDPIRAEAGTNAGSEPIDNSRGNGLTESIGRARSLPMR